MLKFFRKYNKPILGVGFVLLMIVFLLPAGVNRLVGDPNNRTSFTYDGGVITQGEIVQAGRELAFLGQLHPAFTKVLLNVEKPEHWILLTREAKAAGLVGGPDDGRNSLNQLAITFADFELNQIYPNNFQQRVSLRDAAISSIRSVLENARAGAINGGQPDIVVDRILARARGVVRLYTAYLNAQTYSKPELQIAAEDALSEVEVTSAHISAASIVDDTTPEPTADEIRQQFETYKNVPPRTGEFGFGYQREPQVQLEWMILSRPEIDNVVTVDPIDVNVHWQRNKDRFGDDFNEAKGRVEKELHDQKVDRILRVARQVVKGQLLQASGSLETNSTGMPILPADWASRRPSFDAIAQRVADEIKSRAGIEIVPPDTLSDPRWLTRTAVSTVPIIGTSSISAGSRPIFFNTLVFSVPEVGGEGDMRAQVGQAYMDPLQAADGSLCFFRILGARPTSPPDSVEEIRSQIVNDLKRMSAYKSLVERKSEIMTDAMENGLGVATLPFNLDIMYPKVIVKRGSISRRSGASIEDVKKLVDAVFAKAEPLDPTVPTTDLPLAERIVVVEQPSILSLALLEITSIKPISIEEYRSIANQIMLYKRTSLRGSYEWPFSEAPMKARHNLVAVGRSDDDADVDTDDTNGTETTDSDDKPADAGS